MTNQEIKAFFRQLMTTGQVARRLDVSQSVVLWHFRRGHLRGISTPFGYLFRREDVERFANSWRKRTLKN